MYGWMHTIIQYFYTRLAELFMSSAGVFHRQTVTLCEIDTFSGSYETFGMFQPP